MALPADSPRGFRLFVTHVDGEGRFLKISGQLDQQASLMVESLFETARENLERGVGAVPQGAIHEGVICAAKYKDGTYYRAKVINTTNIATGLVGVHFIDYGNKDIISLSTIRSLAMYDPMFLQLRGQAVDYYLSRIIHPSGRWEEPLLLKLQSLLCYAEYTASVDAESRPLPLISVQFKGNDLATHLVATRFGIALPVEEQEALLMQVSAEGQPTHRWPVMPSEPQSFIEHVPFLINQNFPSNPASAMRLQQNVTLPFNSSVPPPSAISQRLLVNNKVSRNSVTLKAPIRPLQQAVAAAISSSAGSASPIPPLNPPSPRKSTTYKSRLLEVNSQHKVFVSFAEDGPELFAVQLVADAKRLQEMMDDINRRPHSSLMEPPMIGTVCLGRMSGDRIICRAIVMNLSGSQCKLFFVDFGDTEMVSYYDIFDIPQEFVKQNVFAMRFCLSGVKKLEKGPHLVEAFKQLVNGKVLDLRVVAPEGPPLIQYGELYLDNNNVLDLLMANLKDKLQFKWMGMMALGSKCSVLVSYVDSCVKFFAQLSDKIDELNAVMEAVKTHCENSASPGELPVGTACCARFPDDDNWYRARVKENRGGRVVVTYVDYGNEQEVNVADLRTITPDLVRLPAQAMKCALKGFENKPVETKTSNQLEMLALEKTLMAHIVGVLSNDTMLVSLVDDTVSPPLDIARKMTQLSQPRSNVEPKATTPTRKDQAPEFSSPEGSEDSRKKGFRREKSFKDERRWEGDEFAQRGGSFRNRDNKEPFDRSGPTRHSEKFGGRTDKERRPKPWEAAASPPSTDDWDESETAQPSRPAFNRENRDFNRQNRDNKDFNRENRDFNRDNRENREFNRENRDFNRDNRENRDFNRDNRESKDFNRDNRENRDFNRDNRESKDFNRDNRENRDFNRDNRENRDFNRDNKDFNRDRRKRDGNPERGPRPNWKKEPWRRDDDRPSVQDRLRRDNKFNQDEGGRTEEWGNRRDSRPPRERRDNNWGDKKENWGEKKDNWGDKKDFQKREFKERGDRPPRSNFTPRDRAGSETDKRSEKSYGSQDSGRVGKAPPYKSRSKFTSVQYRELSEPIDLMTPFEEPVIETGAQHEVSVTWIISPDSFYAQILSHQPLFLEMMHKIPELYKGVKSYSGDVPIGASVLARYPVDGVLYRATVVAVQPFSKFIVQYVDFGNKQLVDYKDIWQLDKQLMNVPKMAVHCSLLGVAPVHGEWKANPDVDLCFTAPRCQCNFQDSTEGQWKVSLWNNSTSVADMLVERQLATKMEHSTATLKDEAIDLTIIVGQQLLCRVTHVDGYEKMYLQLDLEKAALVEAAIENYDATKLTPLSGDSITADVHCTVRESGRVHRAILQDTQDMNAVKAVLPDYGRTVVVSSGDIMILPPELSLYYYQSLECYLHNYSAESECHLSVEQLKEKLEGQKMIVYVNDVEGIRLSTTFYDLKTGSKISIFSPDDGAHDDVTPLCVRAAFNYTFGSAYLSHAQTLQELYLQKGSDTDRLAVLLDELYQFYEEGTPTPLSTFDPDTLCVAKSSDGNWYRCMIISGEEDIEIQFVDYGNTEVVGKDSLKVLDPKFHESCTLALVVSLGLTPLQPTALSTLQEWISDKEVQVTLSFGTDGWLANLHLDGVDLGLKLVNEKLASPQDVAEAAAAQTAPEGCVQAYVSHIDTPGHFWLQLTEHVDRLEALQAELQTAAPGYPDIVTPEVKTICVAKYLADDQWYRAEILDSDAEIITVRFLDYGNADVLDTDPGLIKQLPDNLLNEERYALKCSVNAVPTGTGEWTESATECFTRLVGDLSSPLDALIVLKDATTYVDLFVEGRSVTDQLVAEGYATKSEERECGDLPSCFASHVNSPSEFWIQLEAATPELQAVENAMVGAEDFPELAEKTEGVICAAKYPEDEAWYRAQVVVDGSEGTEVLFMDYGNASIASELRSLPEELKLKPALSRKCALQKPRDVKSWSRQSELKFNELAAEGATIFKVQFIASGDISIVELMLEGRSVTEELLALCETTAPVTVSTPVETPATPEDSPASTTAVTVHLVHINSPQDFYVQLDSATAKLNAVTERLAAGADFESVNELKVGTLCAAFWDEDEQWYRAKILEFADDGHLVLFVDYGNTAKSEQFRQLPEDLALMEPVAKHCKISVDEAAIQFLKDKLDELVAEESSTFQIEYLDSTIEPALVKLLVDGKDVTTLVSYVVTKVEKDAISAPVEIAAEPEAESKEKAETVEARKPVEEDAISTPVEIAAEPEAESKEKAETVEARKPVVEDAISAPVEIAAEPLAESKEKAQPVKAIEPVVDGKVTYPVQAAIEPEVDSNAENTPAHKDFNRVDVDNSVEVPTETVDTKVEEIKVSQEEKEAQPVETREQVVDSKVTHPVVAAIEPEVDSNEENTPAHKDIADVDNQVEMPNETVGTKVAEMKVEEKVVVDTPTPTDPSEHLPDKQTETDATNNADENDEFEEACSDLNVEQDLNESMDSSNTVIENEAFEANTEDLKDTEVPIKDDSTPEKTGASPEKAEASNDDSTDTLVDTEEKLKSPERDDSKDSLNTDTGYTSGGDHDKSPTKDTTAFTKGKLESPKKSDKEQTIETNGSPDKVEISVESK